MQEIILGEHIFFADSTDGWWSIDCQRPAGRNTTDFSKHVRGCIASARMALMLLHEYLESVEVIANHSYTQQYSIY